MINNSNDANFVYFSKFKNHEITCIDDKMTNKVHTTKYIAKTCFELNKRKCLWNWELD